MWLFHIQSLGNNHDGKLTFGSSEHAVVLISTYICNWELVLVYQESNHNPCCQVAMIFPCWMHSLFKNILYKLSVGGSGRSPNWTPPLPPKCAWFGSSFVWQMQIRLMIFQTYGSATKHMHFLEREYKLCHSALKCLSGSLILVLC